MAANAKSQDQELVRVFDTAEESEALVVSGLLESAGIESMVTGMDAPQDILPGVGGVWVRVAADQAEEAKELIEEYKMSGDSEGGEEESEKP